jgi:crotonobetainyl-CoA:carnitine CoA-transferase CaiB-like acyl-CoA transferase
VSDRTPNPSPPPLAGVRVVELARVLAGPWAGQTLADLGAEVIKIERPGSGDDTRAWGPPFAKDAAGNPISDLSAYFMSTNRGKRSVTIDFAQPEGADLVRRLIDTADVVIENFKVGGLVRYGLDYENLVTHNPKLIYASITGFGQDGPYAPRAGYDFMIQAMGGLMSITGAPDSAPGGEPMKVGVAVADVFTGLYATIGILAALPVARETGRGRHLDLALFDVQVATLANQALNYLVSGQSPRRLGNAHPNIVPYQAFAAADGHLIIAVGNDGQFAKLCELAGVAELARDPRYATNPARVAHRGELIAILSKIIVAEPVAFWLEGLENAGVPAGPINALAQTFADPQTIARGLRLDLPIAGGGTAPGVASPIRTAGARPEPGSAPPRLGQDTDMTLQSIGLGAAEIAALRGRGIV